MVRLNTTTGRIASLLITALVMAGCATAPAYPPRQPAPYPPPGGSPSEVPAPQPPQPYPGNVPAPAPRPPVSEQSRPDPGVTLALREQSLEAAARGDNEQAIALIERALRIEPDRPELWIDLARLHLEEGDTTGAEQFARKALLFTRGRPDLEQRAYAVISEAQRTR